MANYGARLNGMNFKSKSALKKAVEAGEKVYFQNTSFLDRDAKSGSFEECFGNSQGNLNATVIVGPDPERDRRWYANPVIKRDGTYSIK